MRISPSEYPFYISSNQSELKANFRIYAKSAGIGEAVIEVIDEDTGVVLDKGSISVLIVNLTRVTVDLYGVTTLLLFTYKRPMIEYELDLEVRICGRKAIKIGGNRYEALVPSTSSTCILYVSTRWFVFESAVEIPIRETDKPIEAVVEDVITNLRVMWASFLIALVIMFSSFALVFIKEKDVYGAISSIFLILIVIFLVLIANDVNSTFIANFLLYPDVAVIVAAIAIKINRFLRHAIMKIEQREKREMRRIKHLGGRVYLYRYSDKYVAVKDYSRDPGAFEVVMKSVSTWLKLSADPSTHPGIVRLLQVDSINKRIVMEYVEGVDLRDYMAKHSVGAKKALDIVEKLSEVMCSVHGRKPPIVHRDLKPENIIVTKSEDIKVCDWEHAIEIQGREFIVTDDFVGTPGYMHPDALQGRYSAKTDVFAIASILYEMITGKRLTATYSSEMLDPYFEDKHIARLVADLIGKSIAGKVEDACMFKESLKNIIDSIKQ